MQPRLATAACAKTQAATPIIRGRSQLSTFMKAYTAYARGEGVWDHRTLFPENQHLILITDNVL